MAKNIVIIFDGTSNQISGDRTNPLRLYGCLERSERQLVYYDPGVGTMGVKQDSSWWASRIYEIWGLATGLGLDQNVLDAYCFLVENFQRSPLDATGRKTGEEDRLTIIGFSRGAYSARVLAGFIHALGLVEPYQLNLLDYAYRTYKSIPKTEGDNGISRETSGPEAAFQTMRLYERTLRTYRPAIKALLLFDTVSSVIEWGKYYPQLTTHPFTRRNRSVEAVRHAVSIDERRTMFHPQLWPAGEKYWGGPFRPKDAGGNPLSDDSIPDQNVKERWFAGVHADVGGGYPEAESALAKVPLEWLIAESAEAAIGLHYDEAAVETLLGIAPGSPYPAPSPVAAQHESLKGFFWWFVECIPRLRPWREDERGKPDRGWRGLIIPFGRHREIPDDAILHPSVKTRMEQRPDYRPPNLPPNPTFSI